LNEIENSVIVEFPLRGNWIAPNTPAKQIPSHGTEQLGQKYAFDFVQTDWNKKGMHFHKKDAFRYFFSGVKLHECFCWGSEIHAPFDAKVVEAQDGLKERNPVHLITDMFVVLKNALTFNPEKTGLKPVLGNYVILEFTKNIFAMFSHLQNGSLVVSKGDQVEKGQMLGKVGHSGNSTAPHLHFQLMDSSDLLIAKGIPCSFEKYEIFEDGNWTTVNNKVPSDKDKIRFVG